MKNMSKLKKKTSKVKEKTRKVGSFRIPGRRKSVLTKTWRNYITYLSGPTDWVSV